MPVDYSFDLAAIYLGFGSIILRGYVPSAAISCRLGYIDVPTIRRSILWAYSLRDWKFNDIVHEFKWFESHKYYFQINLFTQAVFGPLFLSRYKKIHAKKDNQKRIILCNSCGQKLRIPKKAIAIKVNCPKCGASFITEGDETKKTKFQTITIAKLIAIIMLFGAFADNPYGYYQILRWVICGLTGYLAYLAYEGDQNTWTWIFGFTAVLFNPIAPIHLPRDTWSVIDLIAAAIIFTSIFKMKVIRQNE